MHHKTLLAPALLTSLCLAAPPVMASAIMAPHGAGRDADLSGNTVAAPDDGASALLINPAGVVSRARDEALVALLPFSFVGAYRNDASGYDGSGALTAFGLDLWYGLGEIGGWSMGFGAYGSLGAAFDLPADPDIGQTSPYVGELAIINFGFNIGRQITQTLRVGIQLTPSYGQQHLRSPSPLGDIDYDAEGFGLSGAIGLVYNPTEAWAVGLMYRSRGFVDMDGDGTVGDVQQDVKVDFVSPQSVYGGVAYQWTERLKVMGQVVWSRYEDFERGDIEFEQTPMLNQPVMMNTTNRSRWGFGVEYQVFPNSYLRGGYTQSKAMIEDDSMMPMMFDHDNKMVMLGYEIDYGRIMLGFTTGYMHLKSRHVSADVNPMFPGRYASDSDLSAGVRLTWKLGRDS